MRITYGHGGWLRVTDVDLPGPLYLRLRLDGARPLLREVYLDGQDGELTTTTLQRLRLGGIIADAMHANPDWLELSEKHAGPDLSLLAAHFTTGGTRGARRPERPTDWVELQFAQQLDALEQFQHRAVVEAKRPRDAARAVVNEPRAPAPLGPVGDRVELTDEFLGAVAANYTWAVVNGKRPAPLIAEQAGVPVRRVHQWVARARERGILAPTSRGRVG